MMQKGRRDLFVSFESPNFKAWHLGVYPQIAMSVDWRKHEWKEFQTDPCMVYLPACTIKNYQM